MADIGKKMEWDKYEHLNILRMKKSFLEEIKSIYFYFLMDIICS